LARSKGKGKDEPDANSQRECQIGIFLKAYRSPTVIHSFLLVRAMEQLFNIYAGCAHGEQKAKIALQSLHEW